MKLRVQKRTRLFSLTLVWLAVALDSQVALAQFTLLNVGHVPRTNGSASANAVVVLGNYAYLANHFDGLRIYDISNPAIPINVSQINVGDLAYSVAVSGSYVYLAEASSFRIYNISDPSNPFSVGQTNIGGRTVTVSGNYAYVGDGSFLRIYDVSNPTNLTQVQATNIGYTVTDIVISNNYAYLADGGLAIYDVASPGNAVKVGAHKVNSEYSATGLALSGHYAYLAELGDGLLIYDVSNPLSPTNVGSILGGSAEDVVVAGQYAFVVFSSGIRVYNVTNPIQPIEVARVSLPNSGSLGYGQSLVISGNYLYLANGSDGLRIFVLVPKISIERTNEKPQLRFPTFSNQNYSVEYSPDLSSGSWSNLLGTNIQGNGQDVSLTDTNVTMSVNRFYRLKLVP